MYQAGVAPLERVRRVIRGDSVDRVPVVPILHYGTARAIGATIRQFGADPEVMARALTASQHRFGYDGIQVSLSVAVEAEAIGSLTEQPEDAVPYVVQPIVRTPGDLRGLRVPDPSRDGRLPVFVEAVRLLAEQVGDRPYLIATIRGPLNMASQLRGVEQLMLDLHDDPTFVYNLLDFCVEVGAVFGAALTRAGANAIAIGEALCSPAFISPRTYRALVAERHGDLVARLRAAGAEATLLHVCGDIRPILPDLAAAGADIVDIDWQVDPGEADRLAGGRVALRGNLDPSAVLLLGTPAEVLATARQALASAAGARFILGSGCDVAPSTPPANLDALVAAANPDL